MNCLILEDEPLAVEVLKDYIAEVPELKLIAICENAFEAYSVLRNGNIDLLFVDINLPQVTGIEFIKSLNENHKIILTTAYHEFAIEGFNLNVIDYLLKPIEFGRFLQAINKIYDWQPTRIEVIANQISERKFIFFKVDKNHIKIFMDEIVFIESIKDYVKIHLYENHIVTKFRIGELEKILSNDEFIRIHKSFIISKNKITEKSAKSISLGATKIPIGRSYKKAVINGL